MCGDERRLEGKLEDKYNELIKERCMEECDMVQSKAPRPAVDSSSGDTDVDISVLTIDEKVETAGDRDVTGVASGETIQGSSVVAIPEAEGMAASSQSCATETHSSPSDTSTSQKGDTILQQKPVAPVAIEGSIRIKSPNQVT